MDNVKIKCNSCKHINKESDIDHSSCTNEEGEEYIQFDLYCARCGIELYEGSNWGDFYIEDALDGISHSNKCTVLSR